MKVLRYLIVVAALLIASGAYAQEGLFIRVACAEITSPVNLKTWCLNQTDGKLYGRIAGAWVDLTAAGGAAPTDATYITRTLSAGLSAEQALGDLGTGILKNTTTTGVPSIAEAADFPTLNQNTTGNAATATTAEDPFPDVAFASLPAAGTAGRLRWVTDCEGTTTCSAGGGSTRVLHYDDGAAWVPLFPAVATPLIQAIMGAGSKVSNQHDSFANARKWTDATGAGCGVYTHASNGPKYTCFPASGVEDDIDYLRTPLTGKKFGATDQLEVTTGTGTNRLIAGTQAQGDILYFNGTIWTRLAPGTAGQCLKSGGAGANPTWAVC